MRGSHRDDMYGESARGAVKKLERLQFSDGVRGRWPNVRTGAAVF